MHSVCVYLCIHELRIHHINSSCYCVMHNMLQHWYVCYYKDAYSTGALLRYTKNHTAISSYLSVVYHSVRHPNTLAL